VVTPPTLRDAGKLAAYQLRGFDAVAKRVRAKAKAPTLREVTRQVRKLGAAMVRSDIAKLRVGLHWSTYWEAWINACGRVIES
jgi:hypothetical protein